MNLLYMDKMVFLFEWCNVLRCELVLLFYYIIYIIKIRRNKEVIYCNRKLVYDKK